MRLLILLVSFAVYANAQANADCSAMKAQNGQFPPDYGDFGSCGVTIPHSSNCTFSCDNNGLDSWTLQGLPYSCDDSQLTGGPMYCSFNNYVPGKKNCSVTSWQNRAQTECNTMCGGGSSTWTRTVLSYGEPGGEPCPRLALIVPCNSQWCNDNIVSSGYYYWGPFCADANPRSIGYYVNTDQNIDLYVFDEPDFERYTWDSALSTPQNTYYSPVDAYLTTNFESDTFIVPPGKCYYLVLDNTAVGPTQGNNGVYTNVFFNFAIRGATYADGFSDFGYQKGLYQPAAAPRGSSVSFFGAFLTSIIVLILKLE